MSGFGMDGAAAPVEVDAYTAAYRVSGTVHTRFTRVADIVNRVTGSHLAIDRAQITEFANATTAVAAPVAMVAVSEILVLIAPNLVGEASRDMLIMKRPVLAQMALPPLRVTGRIHIAPGGRPIDGLLNVPDRFVAMTDATISSGARPDLRLSVPALAVRRDLAHPARGR